jgi:ParB family chromosome partitioning protein
VNQAPFKRGPLGKGIAALIPHTPAKEGVVVSQIDITDILPNPRQPRTDFDEEALSALTASIKKQGVLHALMAYRSADGGYILVSGERRLRAAGLAGLRTVPVLVVDEPSEHNKLELALIENTQRDDLKPLEFARACASLIEECGYTHEEVSAVVGKARSTVTNSLRLLELDGRVAEALEKKEISEGHARLFLTLPQEYVGKLLNAIIAKNLSVRAAEAMKKALTTPRKVKRAPTADETALERELEECSGLRVTLRKKAKGGGIVELHFQHIDELDTLINKIRAR